MVEVDFRTSDQNLGVDMWLTKGNSNTRLGSIELELVHPTSLHQSCQSSVELAAVIT